MATTGTYVSIDESMVRFAGRSPHTYRLSSKPIPNGYKMMVLSGDGGYIYGCIPFSRADKSDRKANQVEGFSITESSVIELLMEVKQRKKGDLVLVCDNFYTTFKLFNYLKLRG